MERYNTKIFENRFIAGGATEIFTFALLRSVGIKCTLISDNAVGGDILLPQGRQLSVKSNFTGVKAIRLLNRMGDGMREWTAATLFVVAGVGIVFGAPGMVDSSHIRDTSDALELTARGLRGLMADADNVIEMKIAHKPPTEKAGSSQKASTVVAHDILRSTDARDLLKALRD